MRNYPFRKWDIIRMILGRGARCPDCQVKPLRPHKPACPTGRWDGGIWA